MPLASWWGWYLVERGLGCITDGLITVNRYDYELARSHRFIRRPDNIFHVNEVGVNAARFDRLCNEVDVASVKSELGLAHDDPMVLLLAWTLPTKGIMEFLEAARRLVGDGVCGCFLIGGHGPLDERIAEFIDGNDLRGRVIHLGWRRDAHRLMAACDLYVLPTYYPEGLPVSLLEAMACRKPVVATRHRGCEDAVVDGVTGLLVDPRDVEALADASRRLLGDPDMARRFGRAGRARIDDGFRTDQSVQAILAAFDSITHLECPGEVRAG